MLNPIIIGVVCIILMPLVLFLIAVLIFALYNLVAVLYGVYEKYRWETLAVVYLVLVNFFLAYAEGW